MSPSYRSACCSVSESVLTLLPHFTSYRIHLKLPDHIFAGFMSNNFHGKKIQGFFKSVCSFLIKLASSKLTSCRSIDKSNSNYFCRYCILYLLLLWFVVLIVPFLSKKAPREKPLLLGPHVYRKGWNDRCQITRNIVLLPRRIA